MRLQTPVAILSYPNIFEPRAAQEGQEPRYSAAFVFEEGTDLTELKQAVLKVAEEKWPGKAAAMIRGGKLRLPFRTDGEEKGYPPGSTFFNARSKFAPGVVSRIPDPETGKPMEITDPSEIYPGVIVKGLVSVYPYDNSGNRGVTFGLEGLQKIKDGDRLDGRVPVADVFTADESAAASLDDLIDPEVEQESNDVDDINDLM